MIQKEKNVTRIFFILVLTLWSNISHKVYSQSKIDFTEAIASQFAEYDLYVSKSVLSFSSTSPYFLNINGYESFDCLEEDTLDLRYYKFFPGWNKLINRSIQYGLKTWPKAFLKKVNKSKKRRNSLKMIMLSEPIIFEDRAIIYIDYGDSEEFRLYEYENGNWNFRCFNVVKVS